MKIKFPLAALALTAITAGTAFGADPSLLNLVMPDATSLAGVNVTNAEITPFGQYLLTQLTSSMTQQLQTFVTATGFDPRQDVTEIIAASHSGPANPSGLILALGNFPVSQITTAIAQKAPQLTVQNYGGATLIAGSGTGSGFSVAFVGTTIAIVGDTASVKAAIDRSATQNSLSPALTVQVQALSTSEDAWALTTAPVMSLVPGLGTGTAGGTSSQATQIAQMLSSIQASSGGIKFGSNVQITGQAVATDPAAAKSLADVLQALVSIASMAGAQNPQGATIVQLLQGLTISSSGPDVNLALSIPEAQIESIINGMKNQVKPAAKSAVRPAVRRGNAAVQQLEIAPAAN